MSQKNGQTLAASDILLFATFMQNYFKEKY